MSIFSKNTEKHVDQNVFAIWDSKAATYQMPLFAPNSLTLIRELEGLYMDPQQAKNMLVTNASDFTLFKIGEYDRKTAKFTPVTPEALHGLHEIQAMVHAQQAQRNASPLRDVSQ